MITLTLIFAGGTAYGLLIAGLLAASSRGSGAPDAAVCDGLPQISR